MIHKHNFIILCGDTGNALGVLRSLAQAGITPILIYLIEKNHLPVLIKSRYAKNIHKVQDYEQGLQILLTYGDERNKPFVYICDDSELSFIDDHYNLLKDKFYLFNAGKQGRINELMDKNVLCEYALSCGLRIPRKEVVFTGDIPKSLPYPVITKTLKSIYGGWKADSYICHSEEELLQAYKRIRSHELILQEYISKKNELGFMGYSINGGEKVFIPSQYSYFRFSDNGYGHYMYFTPVQDKQLLEKVKSLIRKCNFTGCFEVEFLIDKNDAPIFLEINFRFSYWNFALTYGGCNCPLEWAQAMLNGDITSLELIHKYTAINEPGDFGQSVRHHKISIFQWLNDIIKADKCYIFNKKDPMPAISFWWHKFFRALKK